MKKIIPVVLACLLLLTAMAASAESDVCVRVNSRTFTRQEVQKYINQVMLSIELSSGEKLSDFYGADERQQFLTDVAEHFVTIGVLREKLKEAGQEELSADEQTMLNDYVRTAYEQAWNELAGRIAETYPDMDLGADFVTDVMEEAGYSMNDIYEMGLLGIQEQRLFELYCSDITYTDEELQAYYEENFVAKDREKYADHIGQFEADVILQGGTSAYMPEGFFYVKYLSLTPSQERMNDISAAEAALNEQQAVLEKLNADALSAMLDGSDIEPLRAQLTTAQEAVAEKENALSETKAAAADDFMPLMELIMAAMNDGVSFDEMMDRYSDGGDSRDYSDDGYPFHPQSVLLDPVFVQQVSATEKQGDLVGPFFAGEQVYIVYRAADLAGGAFYPDDETMEAMKAALLYERQNERLNELTAQWRNDMDVTVDTTGLEFPQY